MFTIALFLVAAYLGLKELGRAKSKFQKSRLEEIQRRDLANDLATENLRLQQELIALRRAEILQHPEAKPQSDVASQEPGYRYVTGKKTVLRSQHTTQH
jgi:hypothetical protein